MRTQTHPSHFGHGSLEERGMQRQEELIRLEAWHLDAVLQSFPVLLQISLLIFEVALSGYVWTQQHSVASRIVIAVTATGILLYSIILYASLRSPHFPFQSRLSFDLHGK